MVSRMTAFEMRPVVNTSRPSRTGWERFSSRRIGAPGPNSATTMRTAPEPMSMTAAVCLAGGTCGGLRHRVGS